MGNTNGGKTQVIGAILKSHGAFKLPIITEVTGLDRQLVFYHVNKLVEQGLLIRSNHSYLIHDRNGLLDALMESDQPSSLRLMHPEGVFSKVSADKLNHLIQGIAFAKTLRLPESIEMSVRMNQVLDDSITELKALKRYLNNAQPGRKKALAFYISADSVKRNLDIWDNMVEGYDFEPTVSREEWVSEIGEREE